MLLENDSDDFNNLQEEIPYDVILDSGAAEHVIDDAYTPGYTIEPSWGSKNGKGFIAANGATIANKGQMTLSLTTEDGQSINSTFQVCETNKPLWSVGKICDSGCKVIFGPTKAEVVKNTTGKTVCTFHRKNGLYIATLKLSKPKPTSSFARQGHR